MVGQTRTEMKDDLGAFNEQFRKNAEAVTEQGRQAVNAAQEQFQQNIARVQQWQSDVARTMVRSGQQNTQLFTEAVASFWDASLAAIKAATCSQEQAERALLQAVERQKLAREEGSVLLRDFVELTRKHQVELLRLTQESVNATLAAAVKAGRGETAAE